MSQPFDHSRFDWYPPGYGGPSVVEGTNGPRPALRTPLGTFGVHYAGAGSSWLDLGDTVNELRSVELNHARPSGKPNEYNSVSDSASETWEYAGRFQAAHSSGNNGTVWGHLVLYGLELLTEVDAYALIRGIRRARAQCVTAGYLTPGHIVMPHNLLPGAETSCPGPLWTNAAWWAQIVAPLTPADFDQRTPQPPTDGDDDVKPYIARPPKEFKGQELMFVSSMVRPANSFDVEDGYEVREMDDIKGFNKVTKKSYRVEQYEAMRKAAGLL